MEYSIQEILILTALGGFIAKMLWEKIKERYG